MNKFYCLLIAALLLFTSCSMNQSASMYRNVPTEQDKQGGDLVLRDLCRGMEAFYRGDFLTAKRLFTNATIEIAAVWDDTPEARRARSLWYEERHKPFKGEPYERVMAFYYLGLLYLMEQDFGNAQACFRQSVIQDAFAEEEQFRADIASSIFLQGWALQAQGSTQQAQAAYNLVKELRPTFKVPDMDNQPNVLLIVETGKSPRKVADGVGSFVLRYFRGRNFSDKRVKYSVNNSTPKTMFAMEDVYWQASTRGSRAVDRIIDGVVNFQTTTSDIGSGFVNISNQYLHNPSYQGTQMESVGLVFGAIGIASLALSARARPAADVRFWDNLPDLIHIETLNLNPGKHTLEITFYDENDRPAQLQSRRVNVEVPPNNDKPLLVWVSAHDRASMRYRN